MVNDKELYYFMREHECGIGYNKATGEIEAWVHVDWADVDEFISIINPEYEREPRAIVKSEGICVFVQDIITDDSILEEFEKCFDADDWRTAFVERLYKFGNGQDVCNHCKHGSNDRNCGVAGQEEMCLPNNGFYKFKVKG